MSRRACQRARSPIPAQILLPLLRPGRWNDSTYINLTQKLPNSVDIISIGMYANLAVSLTMKIVKRNSSGNVDVVVSEAFSHPGGGAASKVLTSPFRVPGTGDYYVGAFFNADVSLNYNASQTRIVAGSNITGNGQTGTEASGSTPTFLATEVGTTNDMTLVTTSQTADATVSNGRVLIKYDDDCSGACDSMTFETDLNARVTCDGTN